VHENQNLESAACARPAPGAAVAVALLAMSNAGPYVSVALAAQPEGQILDVTVSSSRVSLVAREVPLADVLAAIGRKAGVKVVLRDALATSVTATLVNIPLEEAIQRLGRWHSLVLIYDRSSDSEDGAALTEVWVRSPYPEELAARARQARSATRRAAREKRPGQTRPLTGPERWAQTLLTSKDVSPEMQRRQLEALVLAHGEYPVVAALRDVATRAPVPRARRAAIQVLGSIGSPDAIEAIRATLADSHPGVRSEAQTALRRQRRARASEGASDQA
jgi:HEAT repeats